MDEAKVHDKTHIEVWGSGRPRREFIFSRDLARACLFLMDSYEGEEPINIGVGCDSSIKEIAEMIRDVVGYTGELIFNHSKPDGMPAKLLDSSHLAELGWTARTPIREALSITYDWFRQHGPDLEGNEDARAVL